MARIEVWPAPGALTQAFVVCCLAFIGGSVQAASSTPAASVPMKRISPQYIAALGPPGAMSGTGATAWGLWSVDPGATMPPVASCLKQDYAVLIVIGVEDKGR